MSDDKVHIHEHGERRSSFIPFVVGALVVAVLVVAAFMFFGRGGQPVGDASPDVQLNLEAPSMPDAPSMPETPAPAPAN